MKFDRVHDTLRWAEEKEEMTILDALDIFYDLCEDIRDGKGRVLEDLSVGDAKGLTGRFCWLERMLARIYEGNREAFQKSDLQERINASEERILPVRTELQKLEKEKELWQENEREIEALTGTIREYRQQEEEWEQARKLLEALKKEHASILENEKLRHGALAAANNAMEMDKSFAQKLNQVNEMKQMLDKKREELSEKFREYQEQYQSLVHLLENEGELL